MTDPLMREKLPRCDKLDGSTLRIVPAYTEAGYFCEANCVTITDGERSAVFVPQAELLHAELDAGHLG